MHETEHQKQTRALLREVVLALMGTFNLYDVDPQVETTLARALTQLANAKDAGIGKPRWARGRAAMRALLNEIERPDRMSQSEQATDTEASR